MTLVSPESCPGLSRGIVLGVGVAGVQYDDMSNLENPHQVDLVVTLP